jgi:8-oxo-dGTP diphosphatase
MHLCKVITNRFEGFAMLKLSRIRVATAEIEQNGAFLIVQRRPEAALPLLWEFPGGRVREGESDTEALKRCIKDRLGVDCAVGTQALHVVQDYEGYSLELVVYHCMLQGKARAARVHAIAWVKPEDFGYYHFPKADQQTIDLLLNDV